MSRITNKGLKRISEYRVTLYAFMAEQIDPFEQRSEVLNPSPQGMTVEYGKLQTENGRLKLELERTRDESSANLISERRNAKISQQLIDELNKKVGELESPGILSPEGRRGSVLLNEVFIENLVLEKTGLESQVSEQKREICALNSELKSTKQKLETETVNFSKFRETHGHVETARRKSASDIETGDFLVAKEDIFEEKKQKRTSKTELIGLEIKLRKLQEENEELSDENKTLTQEFHKHERDKVVANQITEELLAAKDENNRFKCHTSSLENKISQDAHRIENMELELKTLQGREEELKQVNREFQEVVNKNQLLQLRMNRLREEKDVLLGKAGIKHTELENRNIELKNKLRKLEEVFKEESDEMRERESMLTQSLKETTYHRNERDVREVETYRNAPRKTYLIEPTQRYQAPEQVTLTRSKSSAPVETTENPYSTDPNTPTTPLGVKVNWEKEVPTLEREITYFDNIHEPVTLTWLDMEQLFQGTATFSVGKHTGSITLPTHDDMYPVQPFEVRKGMDVLTLKLVNTMNKHK